VSARALLLAAFPPELAGLDRAPPVGWHVATTGVGAVTAAAATARLIAERRPSRVLLVGTCGAYDARLAVGDLVVARTAIVSSLDELEARAYRPGPEEVRFDASWALPLPLPAHDVVAPPAITVTAAGAAALGRLGAVEHLELAGVFAACRGGGVPAASVLGVANRVGPGANVEWRANHARVSAAVIAALRPLL
jgi:purine-nucleoside phosphorylase